MAQTSTPKSSWFALALLIVVFAAMFTVLIRTSAQAAGPVLLSDQDGCEFRLSKDDRTQKVHLSRVDRKAEGLPREASLKIWGDDGQPEEIRLRALPKSGRDGFAEYEGKSKSGRESFVGVELRISFGQGAKEHVLSPED